MMVNFLIAGVQKGGTSSLDAYLRQHPRICMADVKETHFFDNESEFAGSVDYENYHRFFRRREAALYGEATPIYSYWPQAMPRIRDYNPQMKLVVLLRNPIERAWSAWRMEHNRGAEAVPFSDAIRNEPGRVNQELPHRHRVYSYIGRGLYAEQIRRIRRYFGNQALFLKSERFFSETGQAVGQVIDFLGLEQHSIDTSAIHFRGEPEAPPSLADREYLRNAFRSDVALVEDLLGWDCSDWLRI